MCLVQSTRAACRIQPEWDAPSSGPPDPAKRCVTCLPVTLGEATYGPIGRRSKLGGWLLHMGVRMAGTADLPWVVVEADKRLFAIATGQVREMLIAPRVARVPRTPESVRGVMNLRGQVMPLVDLRMRLGVLPAGAAVRAARAA